MKKLLLLATILAANIWSASAQTNTKLVCQQDSVVSINSKGEVASKSKTDYTYDAKGNRTQQILYKWSNNAWVNNIRYSFTYDAQGNKTLQFSDSWNGTDWANSSKAEYIYDAKGNLTQVINSSWRNNDWANSSKSESTYDAQGNKTQVISYTWKGTAWENNTKTDYTNDAQGHNTQYIYYKWKNNAWENQSKFDFTYDAQGNQTQQIYSKWNGTAWENGNKNDYTYDAQGHNTQKIYCTWNGTAWANYSKNVYTYDKYNNQISNISYSWATSDWAISTTNYYYYSPACLMVTVPAAGMATVYFDEKLIVPAGYVYGMKYKSSTSSLDIACTAKAGEIVPANQGYLFEAEAGTYAFFITDEAAVTGFTSCLKGVTESTPKVIVGYTIYTLASGTKGLGFYKFNGTNLAPYKAYYTETPPSAKEFIGIGSETTGINQINANANVNANEIYNLQGQRIGAAQRGINIIGGKKIYVK